MRHDSQIRASVAALNAACASVSSGPSTDPVRKRTAATSAAAILVGMPGVRFTTGSDIRIPAGALRISIGEDGEPTADPIVPQLRTDMWPHWLLEAVDAVPAARSAADEVARLGAVPERDEAALDLALGAELRATMRAITASAFAIDSFYSSVKERSPAHPHAELWRAHRTSRHAQVYETIRYSLKLRNPGAQEIRERIRELFRFRDWAVHPGSQFRDPIVRADVDAGVDWHFVVFRADNAVGAVAKTVSMMDVLVERMLRGSEELRRSHAGARKAMTQVLEAYDEAQLPAFPRTEESEATGS